MIDYMKRHRRRRRRQPFRPTFRDRWRPEVKSCHQTCAGRAKETDV